jgi:hypothetical protein
MQIINKIVTKIGAKRTEQIQFFMKNAAEVQNTELKNLLETAQNTEWGKKYNYEKIKDYQTFRQNVPVSSYDDLKPYIEKIRKGEQNILWHSEIKWFAQSSGTTSDKSKFIPVSNEALENCHFRGGKDLIILYSNAFPESNLFKGRALAVGGSRQIQNIDNNLYYGDLSAVIIQNLPFWANFMRTPAKSIALMPEWESKIEQMAEKTSKQNVTNISGVPSWTLVLMKKIIEITGKKNLSEVWPNLDLFIHGGVSFVPYRKEFEKLIPSSQMRYMETYNASEGFFAVQDDLSNPGMLLMLDYGIFYEFIPMSDFEKGLMNAVSLEDVEIGINYALVISTNGGLWRYLIGDTVIFTETIPYRIKIIGRTKHFINAFGEELMIENSDKAISKACELTGAIVNEYTAAPVFMSENSKGRHEWLVEFSVLPANLGKFTEELDNALKSVNSDYEAKRYKSLSLTEPIIKIAKPNLFYLWLKNNNKLGGQHKIPRLSNNREYLEELLKLNELI